MRKQDDTLDDTVIAVTQILPGLKRYRDLGLLGEGGMATVHRALDQGELQREVAIKIVKKSKAKDRNFVKRFKAEARTVASLTSNHVINVFDYGEINGQSYMVMEYLKGGTLQAAIGSTGLPWSRVSRWASELASALNHIHGQPKPIVHRDVKPSNLLIRSDETVVGESEGTLVLADFGIAKSSAIDNKTVAGAAVGAPGYMAPEQALGLQVSPGTDMYAFALVFYEMVVGTLPGVSEHPVADPEKNGILDTLESRDIPHEIAAFVSRCLVRDPELRPTAAEFSSILSSPTPDKAGWLDKVFSGKVGWVLAIVLLPVLIFGTYFLPLEDRTPRETPIEPDAAKVVQLAGKPSDLRLFIDGVEHSMPIHLENGRYSAMAIARGYQGWSGEVQIADDVNTIAIELNELRYPTPEQFAQFLTLWNEGGPMPAALPWPLDDFVTAHAGNLSDVDLKEWISLADNGDAGASLLVYLLDEKGVTTEISTEALQWLKRAAGDGYGLASLWLAVQDYRRVLSREIPPTEDLRELFLRAQDQGIDPSIVAPSLRFLDAALAAADNP